MSRDRRSCCASSAPRLTRRRWRSTAASYARHAPLRVASHEPRAPARERRSGVPGCRRWRPPRTSRSLRALPARSDDRDRRALLAPRRPSARRRASRRPHEGALACADPRTPLPALDRKAAEMPRPASRRSGRRLEPRPSLAGRAARLPSTFGLRGRVHAGRR
jgi:hypothetical protein